MRPSDSVTRLLRSAAEGDDAAARSLFELVYGELRQLAGSALRSERRDHTLQPTALVHEAYLRLAEQPADRWNDRAHFFAVAARAMRRILVDYARSRKARKRGSGAALVSIDGLEIAINDPDPELDLVLLDQALERLAALDPRQARIVELRFFGGLSVEETAAAIAASERTVKRDWQAARAWLRREIARLSFSS